MLPPHRAILLCHPTHFTVDAGDNPHMLDSEGNPNVVDPAAANAQWNALCDAYRNAGQTIETMDAAPGLVDQVFTANPVFAYPAADGTPSFLRARMTFGPRQPEVDLLAAALESRGAVGRNVPGDEPFEGGGDLLWQGTRRVLLGGYGFRSTKASIEAAAKVVDAPLVPLRLVDERFYHLDTCLAVLDNGTALWVPAAFDEASRERLHAAFDQLIAIPESDWATFAGNAHCPDGRHVVMDAANGATAKILESRGYAPVLVDTSEFRKSGGSVYCMKQVIW